MGDAPEQVLGDRRRAAATSRSSRSADAAPRGGDAATAPGCSTALPRRAPAATSAPSARTPPRCSRRGASPSAARRRRGRVRQLTAERPLPLGTALYEAGHAEAAEEQFRAVARRASPQNAGARVALAEALLSQRPLGRGRRRRPPASPTARRSPTPPRRTELFARIVAGDAPPPRRPRRRAPPPTSSRRRARLLRRLAPPRRRRAAAAGPGRRRPGRSRRLRGAPPRRRSSTRSRALLPAIERSAARRREPPRAARERLPAPRLPRVGRRRVDRRRNEGAGPTPTRSSASPRSPGAWASTRTRSSSPARRADPRPAPSRARPAWPSGWRRRPRRLKFRLTRPMTGGTNRFGKVPATDRPSGAAMSFDVNASTSPRSGRLAPGAARRARADAGFRRAAGRASRRRDGRRRCPRSRRPRSRTEVLAAQRAIAGDVRPRPHAALLDGLRAREDPPPRPRRERHQGSPVLEVVDIASQRVDD